MRSVLNSVFPFTPSAAAVVAIDRSVCTVELSERPFTVASARLIAVLIARSVAGLYYPLFHSLFATSGFSRSAPPSAILGCRAELVGRAYFQNRAALVSPDGLNGRH